MTKRRAFPGMDPYLEAHWSDVHTSLMVYARDQINDMLLPDLRARVEESLSVASEDDTRVVYPDVHVIEDLQSQQTYEPQPGAVAVAEPRVIAVPDEKPTERHIEIIDRSRGNRVVTAIEVLNPANKTTTAGWH